MIRRNIKMMDKPLFFLTFIMSLFGLFMIFSASYVRASLVDQSTYKYLIRQGLILLVSFGAFFISINFKTENYKKIVPLLIFVIFGLLLVVLVYGDVINGARSWIKLPFFNLQPSEFAKTVLILYMAIYYSSKLNKIDSYLELLKPLIVASAMIFLIFIQPDLGTSIIIFTITILTYFSIPIKSVFRKKLNKIILGLMGFAALIVIISLLNGKSILKEHQRQRLIFFSPCDRYTEKGTGYQVCNGYIAINRGGLFGVGIGNSTQKYFYLPEAHTDFIFPIIVEELGALVGVLILLIYLYIIYRILIIAKKSSDLKNSIICYGIAIYIFSHVFINMVGILGLFPLTGVPLPFLSYGGSFALNLIICMSIVCRISIENNIYKKEEAIRTKIREK